MVDNSTQESGDTGIKRGYLFLLGAILLILAAGYFFSSSAPSKEEASNALTQKDFSEAFKSISRGNFSEANKYFEDIAGRTTDSRVKTYVEIQIAANKFIEFEIEGQLEAIRELKSVFNNTNLSNQLRALALNRLIGFYYYGRDPIIAQAIFADEPFSTFLVGDDIGLAMRKIGEYSYSLAPSSMTKVRFSFWYGGELLDNKELSLKTKKEYGEKITALVEESRQLFESEPQQGFNSIDAGKALFWHFHALNLATLAVAGLSKTPGDFEQSFQKALSFDKPELGESNNLMRELSAFIHFYYGALLYEASGNARIADVRSHAEKVVEVVSSAKELEKIPFYQLMRVERDKPVAKRDHNYRFFLELASVSPVFSKFLVENGWKL